MLNEKQQAFEYIYDQDSMKDVPRRLKEGIFLHNDDFNGLEGILTSIARYFIYEDDALNENVGRYRAEAAMRMWLGFAESLPGEKNLSDEYEYLQENYPWLDNWLIKNLSEQAKSGTDKARERVEKAKIRLKRQENQYASSSLDKVPRSNTYKLLKYEKVMANAMSARGPLKKYYLVCRIPDWKTGVNKLKGTNPLGKLDESDEDRILKLLAAYLIERNRKLKSNDDYVFEPVNFSDIGFWQFAQGKTDSSKYSPYTYQRYESNERVPLFNFYSSKSNNLAKTKPDEEWFEICGWELIEATDNDDKLGGYLEKYPEAVFYSDPGASRYLNKNERYQR